MESANWQLDQLTMSVKKHGYFKGAFIIHFASNLFAETARDPQAVQELLEQIKRFLSRARALVMHCIMMGVGPFGDDDLVDAKTKELTHTIRQRFAQTGWCICIDSSALHSARRDSAHN